MRYVLGFDGGGTKTECVLMDETGAILARSRSGASNAVNVGAEASAAALAEAGKEALGSAAKSPFDVACLLAGISGAGEPSVRAEIQAHLKVVFPTATLVVTSDLVLSLAATAEIPSVVVIAGTGSAVLGRTSPLKVARAGGFGPVIGDTGSANDIGRTAVARCFQKFLNKETFLLTDEICRTFHCTWPQFVDLARQQPAVIFPKVFPIVAKAAESGDFSARAILSMAAANLIEQVREVVGHLELRNTNFFLAKTGGVFEGSPFLGEQFDLLLGQMVHNARPGPRLATLRLIRDLYLMDLVQLALSPAVPAELKRNAEEQLLMRLPQIPLGQKITLARRGPGRVAGALLTEGHPQVLAVVLDNPYLTEAQVLKAPSRQKLSPRVVPANIHHRKWSISYNIRIAVLRQPNAPLNAILSYLPQLTVSDLRELAAPGIVPETLRRYIQAEVQRRLGAAVSKGPPASRGQ